MCDDDCDIDWRHIAIGVVCFIGVLLTLILVPLHFSYIERQHIGFKKNSVTNVVDQSQVYGSGTHSWGVGKSSVEFPAKWKYVDFRGAHRLSFFTDAGEITVGVSFYYRITRAMLPQLYNAYGLASHERVVAVAQSELRNAATNYTIREYQEQRTVVADGLYRALAAAVPTTAFVEVNRNFFFLEDISLPTTVLDKREQVFTNLQQQITQQFNRTATQTRLDTLANVSLLQNQAEIIKQNATVVSERLRAGARSLSFGVVQKEAGVQLKSMMSTLSVTQSNVTTKLIQFNKLLDALNNLTLLSGVTGAVLSP